MAPLSNGDLPRIVVTLDYDRLRESVLHGGLIGGADRLTAGQLRALACDAELLPVVLRGDSQVLGVGRAHRLVTPALRTALTLEPARDGPPGRRWEVIIGDDQLPAVRPPDYVDPRRRPRLHQRFRLRPPQDGPSEVLEVDRSRRSELPSHQTGPPDPGAAA